MSKKLQGNLLLLLTALIWGSSFVAQRAGMEHIGPFTFNGLRSILGGLVLIPVVIIMSKISAQKKAASENDTTCNNDKEGKLSAEESAKKSKAQRKTLLAGGIACGIVLFAASSLQQAGMIYTSAGKGGFITALYIVLVPIFGRFLGKKVRPIIWFCVAIATVGLYLLCIKEGFTIGKGDVLVFFCAIAFTVHILVIDHFSPKVDGVKMSCLQFFVCGLISLPCMFIFETVQLQTILTCWLPICYAGVLSCGVAYTLQIVAQKNTDPTIASLIMSLESVFAVLAGFVVLGELLSLKEAIGCVIMFTAIILAQLPSDKLRLKSKGEK